MGLGSRDRDGQQQPCRGRAFSPGASPPHTPMGSCHLAGRLCSPVGACHRGWSCTGTRSAWRRRGGPASWAAGQRGPLPSHPLQTPLQGLAPPPARWRSRAHTQSTCRPRTPAHALGEARSRMCDPENGNLRFDGARGSQATPPLPDAATAPPRAPPGPAVPRLTPRRRELSGQSVETPRS